MGLNVITASAAWPASPQYTASGDTDILLQAPVGHNLAFAVESAQPATNPHLGPLLKGGEGRAMQLLDGQGLYVVALDAPGSVTLVVQD